RSPRVCARESCREWWGPARTSVAIQEVLQQLVTVLGQDGFGMELHAFERQRAVLNAHDLFARAVSVLRPRRNLEAIRQRFLLDDERMVARCTERIREPLEHATVVVVDLRDLAVHHAL